MRILCILQNAWGWGPLPVTFRPNPLNHSAKVIRKMVGESYYEFSNTTDVVTRTAKAHAGPNYRHFEKVMERIPRFDLVMVCGAQAKETVNRYLKRIEGYGKPLIFVPHPASRMLTNAQCAEIREKIEAYERENR